MKKSLGFDYVVTVDVIWENESKIVEVDYGFISFKFKVRAYHDKGDYETPPYSHYEITYHFQTGFSDEEFSVEYGFIERPSVQSLYDEAYDLADSDNTWE